MGMYVEFVFLNFKFPLNAYQPQNIEASLVVQLLDKLHLY